MLTYFAHHADLFVQFIFLTNLFIHYTAEHQANY